MSSKEILCTLGPSSMNDRVISRLTELGVNLFRINLSHTKLEDVASVISFIQERTNVPICLDSEGAQIRTGSFVDGAVEVKDNALLWVHKNPRMGDAQNFNLYPPEAVDLLEKGDFISIDFNSVLVQVIEKTPDKAQLRVLNRGRIGSNKAVTVERDICLPVMTQKDQSAFKIGQKMGIKHIALSFANTSADVDQVRKICGDGVFLISKIECRQGLTNLNSIAEKSDAILIDRGDLSRQEPIERIPRLQKAIIKQVKAIGKKVYVATNLLESMVTEPKPTRAEVNDVINTLTDGADGLVLAAETAIGKDPIGCVGMIIKLIHEYESNLQIEDSFCSTSIKSLLVQPHGGALVNQEHLGFDQAQIKKLAKLQVRHSDLMDCEQIASGMYSPLTGFMNVEAIRSVLDTNQLPDTTVWTLPILLQLNQEQVKQVRPGENVLLCDGRGDAYALMNVKQIEPFNPKPFLKQWFGTDSIKHPGVAETLSKGDTVVSGKITLVKKLETPYQQYQLTPAQSRFIFMHKGWSRVVGFHTRNVIHRAHEYIQMRALEIAHADGLYVSPIISPQKKGDFLPGPILRSYQVMMDQGFYPVGKVLIGCFATYPRFCGPREAVFTAICRKNMGCSHFIIGRNHSGVGDYYQDSDYKKLFDTLGDIGISPIFFDAIGYDHKKDRYDSNNSDDLKYISGTEARQALLKLEKLPDWYMRESIQTMLRDDIQSNTPVFFT